MIQENLITPQDEDLYHVLAESVPLGVLIARDKKIIYINKTGISFFGYPNADTLINKSLFSLIPDAVRPTSQKRRGNTESEQQTTPHEVTHVDHQGNERRIETVSIPISFNGDSAVLVICRDVTYPRNIESIIRDMKRELDEKSEALDRKEAALLEIMERLEQDNKKRDEQIRANIAAVILPLLDKIRSTATVQQNPSLDILEKSILSMTDSFGARMTQKMMKLSARELEISSMIKHGLSTKEMAHTLHISIKTIETYRKRIRKKLGLKNERRNLTAYLKNTIW